eukprot:TRINITY_DN21133_c0_g1_i1.p2 TRINITY_DN21133_c0_g1~~TRINITY_DN21133_c0_g1_i1.p2  ORF type:complete len:129 (+),score=18.52 TRINITY_DN21133_c0_g1_i1:102-488(+)
MAGVGAQLDSMGVADAMVLGQRVTNAQNELVQRLCWDRCQDTLRSWEPRSAGTGSDEMPQAARQCIDACTSKYTESSMIVSLETQAFQERLLRQHQRRSALTTLALGAVGTGAVVGLGCYLFGGGSDD